MPPRGNRGDPSEASEGEARRDQEREQFLDNLSDSPAPHEAAQPARVAPVGAARSAIDPELGVVVLNGPAIRKITTSLRERILKDPRLRARFYENPRAVLASVGLNDEIQAEILRVDRDFGGSPFFDGGRLENWCITTTCCCTNCCKTCWISF
jgi:hypothetical protein